VFCAVVEIYFAMQYAFKVGLFLFFSMVEFALFSLNDNVLRRHVLKYCHMQRMANSDG